MADKMRVHLLAKELNVPSKVIIEKCKAEGITAVKNHMSTLSAGLHATIREWFSEGSHETTIETAERVDLKKVQLPKRKRKKVEKADDSAPGDGGDVGVATAEPEAPTPEPAAAPEPEEPTESTNGAAAEEAEAAAAGEAAPPDSASSGPEEAPTVESASSPTAPVAPPAADEEDELSAAASSDTAEAAEEDASAKKAAAEAPGEAEEKEEVAPAGPQNVPKAAKLSGPRVVRYEAPDYDQQHFRPRSASDGGRGRGPGPRPAPGPGPSDAGTGGGGKKRRGRRGGAGDGDQSRGWRDRDLEERRERLQGATGRRMHRRRTQQGGGGGQVAPSGPKTEATVHEPVQLKEFCAETGLNFMQIFKVLKDEHNVLANVNMTIPNETAELLAIHFGIELTVVPAKSALDQIQEEFAARERKKLTPRPPVVAILGHVDHGKTSLLDAIRRADVAAGEDGGITQHISSYNVKTSRGAVTFVDTPGHEAFTAMRQRGAQMTDVVVLVIAADDGVMPQTIEAIKHAQAAEVPVVVALNKIDLGDQNKVKIFGQLSEHGLTPSGDWGGEVDVIPTSATTKQGVTELVEHLADLTEVLELKADATLPATGTVIEAETKPGVGAVVQLLVQEGTLKVGDFVVCGNAFGKVRALQNDRGKRVKEAPPSIPIEVWGLDDVPQAGDKLYVVDSLQRAGQIAGEVKHSRQQSARQQSRKMRSLEELLKQRDSDEVPELNVIIKADVDGSLAALRPSLEDIPSDEVKLSIRHAAVGPVNDSDVLLASTSEAIIIAYRVDVPATTRRLADEHGVDVRPYRVIYEVCDDIRKALSGLLAPEERVENRAEAEVRQVFRVSKAGVVAGSFVTSGTVHRDHFARVVRDGVLVREKCRLASLKHFKDDAKEVRQGLECGIRLEGFDDVHAGDIIQTYEIVQIARSL